jgi:hypothetical protein
LAWAAFVLGHHLFLLSAWQEWLEALIPVRDRELAFCDFCGRWKRGTLPAEFRELDEAISLLAVDKQLDAEILVELRHAIERQRQYALELIDIDSGVSPKTLWQVQSAHGLDQPYDEAQTLVVRMGYDLWDHAITLAQNLHLLRDPLDSWKDLGLAFGELVDHVSDLDVASWDDLELLLPLCQRVLPALHVLDPRLGGIKQLDELVHGISDRCAPGAKAGDATAEFMHSTRLTIVGLSFALCGHLLLKCRGEPKPWLIVDETKQELIFLDVCLPFRTLENRLLKVFLLMTHKSETWLTDAELIAGAQLACEQVVTFGPYISDIRKWFKRSDIQGRMGELPAKLRNLLKLIECKRTRAESRSAFPTSYRLQIPQSRILWR